MGIKKVMQNLVNEIYDAIQSGRIANVKESIGDIVSVLKDDKNLQNEVAKLLSRKDILWFNKNNEDIFFAIPDEQGYYSSKELDLTEELKWFTQEINSAENINWDNIKYRYKKALKLLGTKDVIYYNNIRKVIALKHQDRWRYLNE